MNDNPAFGADLQPFMGRPSFMRLPVTRDLAGVDVAILGVPFDSGTSHRSGARLGPRKIREMSLLLWGYHSTLNVRPAELLKIVDYGDVSVVPTSITHTMETITGTARQVIEAGTTLVTLGGDHSIALPLLRAHAGKFGPLAVLHIDAHLDTWEAEFEGVPYSHGTPFRHALQEGLIARDRYMQVGIRGSLSGENDYAEARDLGARTVTITEVMERGLEAVLGEIRARLAGPLYISLDIDSADPAFAPGTGTPEVGGFSSFQLLQLLRGLRGLDIVGCDLVEVAPAYDHGDITAVLAANLVFEYLSLLAQKKQHAQ
jgi:agmatinase/guanidinopropionase